MKFGVREICDVVLRAKANQKIGNKIFYKDEPVLYFDTLKTSTMEGAATTVYAQGGRGNSRLVAWEGERTVTFTMEDALISPTGFAILSGAGLVEASENNKIKVHKTEVAEASEVNEDNGTITIKLKNNIFGDFIEEKIPNLLSFQDKQIIFSNDATITVYFSEENYNTIIEDLKNGSFDENNKAYFQVYLDAYEPESERNNRFSKKLITVIKKTETDGEVQYSISTPYLTKNEENKGGYYCEMSLFDFLTDKKGLISSEHEAKLYFTNSERVMVLSQGTQPEYEQYYTTNNIYCLNLNNNGEVNSEPYIPKNLINNKIIKLDKQRDDLQDIKVGDQFLVDYYTEIASGAQQIEITPDKFGGNYYLEASTLFRDQDGVDHPAQFIIPNCKVQSNFTFTMASSGDPSTFTFTMDAFPDYLRFDKSKKVLAAIQIEDSKQSGNSIVRDRTKSNQKI